MIWNWDNEITFCKLINEPSSRKKNKANNCHEFESKIWTQQSIHFSNHSSSYINLHVNVNSKLWTKTQQNWLKLTQIVTIIKNDIEQVIFIDLKDRLAHLTFVVVSISFKQKSSTWFNQTFKVFSTLFITFAYLTNK